MLSSSRICLQTLSDTINILVKDIPKIKRNAIAPVWQQIDDFCSRLNFRAF